MNRRAFSIIELLVAMVVTAVLLTLLASLADSAGRAWQRGESQVETYSNARGAMNLLGRELQGAVIDLDFGFRVETISGEPNNFVLKFLRRKPTDGSTYAIEKVAYQLAWAGKSLLPEISSSYSSRHPIPVLIRTVNSDDLMDVFEVSSATEVDRWSRDWGVLSGVVQAGQRLPNGDIVEVAADYILGWWITPVYWNSALAETGFDSPAGEKTYFDQYLTSNRSPQALMVRLLSVPSRAAVRLEGMGEWSTVRANQNLADFPDLPGSTFLDLLRQQAEVFEGSFYLSSKTP